MPPSAPESSRNGGTRMSSAGNVRNDSMRFSIVIPAITSTAPARTRTGSDSRAILRRIGRRARRLRTSATRLATAQRPARVGVNQLMPTRYVARNRLGKVTMSPAAVTSGDWTLSRSKSKRTEIAVTTTTTSRTTTDDNIPPTTEITTKSAIEIEFATPNATETALASTARTSEIDSDNASDAATFWPTSVSSRRDTRNVPAWIAVPRRLPSAPKTLPRMPMAAGTSTRRPGSASRVPVMAPSVRPARRSPPDERRSATNPAPTPLGSERTTATKRRRRRGRRTICYSGARSSAYVSSAWAGSP